MKWSEVFCNTFKALCEQIDPEVKRKVDFMLPSMPMVDACRTDDFDFFLPLINAGRLTVSQMHHAAQRYHLGKTRTGKPIFWMIDDMMQPLDALVGTDIWLSTLLKARMPRLLQYWPVKHCLFGLHLLSVDSLSSDIPVSIVESERSAVILSELFPENLWLATMTNTVFTYDLLMPLCGRKVKVFPHTDETMSNYLSWLEIVDMARRTYHLDIECSSCLENHATAAQKHRAIDILGFILENH